MKICSVFGHSDFFETEENINKLKKALIQVIEQENINHFYLGGYGNFDNCCARLLKEIKITYPDVKSYLILAYLKNNFSKDKKEYISNTFDEIIYPPLEEVPPKFAILKRNQWIVNKSYYIIFFVNRSWGGARKALDYAIKKGKKFLNIGDKTFNLFKSKKNKDNK